MFRRPREDDDGIDQRHPSEMRHELLWLVVGVVVVIIVVVIAVHLLFSPNGYQPYQSPTSP